MSCRKNRMTTRVTRNTLAHTSNAIDHVRVNNAFLIELLFILTAIKFYFEGLYDKQILTLVVISCEIYETRRRLIS